MKEKKASSFEEDDIRHITQPTQHPNPRFSLRGHIEPAEKVQDDVHNIDLAPRKQL